MISSVKAWLMNFDITKGVVVVIIAVLGTYYDLRSEVKINHQETVEMKRETVESNHSQETRDHLQDKSIEDLHRDIQQGFSDLRSDVRALKR